MASELKSETEHGDLLTRREAVRRVGALLGGVAFIGGGGLLAACERAPANRTAVANGQYKPVGQFSAADVAVLDEIADTILPTTQKSPGAKAAATGPFMALMVTDTYKPRDQQAFRDGLRQVDDASRKANGVAFVDATPQARTALLVALDREQKADTDARNARLRAAAKASGTKPDKPRSGAAAAGKKLEAKRADANVADQRQEQAGTGDVASGAIVTDDIPPAHYFRMMKELALLGYFTSEIGCTKAMRYADTPGRFDPCAPYTKGQPALAPHA